ncbi:hypothetical protein K437DRAFT_267449 [Tilletiaria anomala UBC 951]|uniref:Uncharacterized protein n=1 Tax=Tilletiaria anomala (strain ATCC 24038 / CBS 436.72 / UBC 951) TaxID=1037660 RepID=A0A066W9F4_TILAU|nr:uncharacterized protein K437DRAFT_267449 [Tilletiaria anomala UBC 951]KDN49188.1 hypothetical protein K437DRAFT_267449 [Tilletiaria anomala UBC 951]
MSGGGVNPVLSLVSRTDTLAEGFRQVHQASLPLIPNLQQTYHQVQGSWTPEIENYAEDIFSKIRDILQHMEKTVEEMMNLLYQVDIYLSDSTTQLAAGFNPKEALDHVSASVHSYQSELLSKRELLADLTCEEITIEEFSSQWRTLNEVEAGKKQDLDSLADMFAGFG